MSFKVKLISAVSALVLVLSLLIVGVLAAQSATINLGGTITFQAKDVQATISAATINNGTLTDSANKLQAITLDADNDGADEIATWSGLVLSFEDSGEDLTVTFTVTNDHPEKALVVTTTQTDGTTDNATMTASVTGGTGTVASNSIAVGQSAEYTVTFHIEDRNDSASITGFNLALNLTMAP